MMMHGGYGSILSAHQHTWQNQHDSQVTVLMLLNGVSLASLGPQKKHLRKGLSRNTPKVENNKRMIARGKD